MYIVGIAYIWVPRTFLLADTTLTQSYVPDHIVGRALYSALPTKTLTNHIAKYTAL